MGRLPVRLVAGALATLTLAACHHPEFVLNAKGDKKVDMRKDFVMTEGGVVQNGKCDESAFPRNSPHALSQVLITFLGHHAYCTSGIVEYQDEQRIIVPAAAGGGATYGSRVRMFANPWLGNYRDSTEFERDWINVAIIEVGKSPVASVPDGYPALHLALGENCLFIHFDGKGPIRRWQAAMVNATGTECIPEGGPNEPDESQQLAVATEQPSLSPDDYPAVPRIHEGKHGSVLLGVRCGNMWCVVGTRTSSDIEPPAQDDADSGRAPASPSRTRGWSDDQRLGVMSGGTPDLLEPSDQRASIVPVDGLQKITLKQFLAPLDQDWPLVATVILRQHPPDAVPAKYDAGTPGHPGYGLKPGKNYVWLHADSGKVDGKDTVFWTARIGRGPDNSRLRKLLVVREEHPGYVVPGTARWGWTDKDEQLWVACMVGCCMVKPDNSALPITDNPAEPH